MIVHVLWCCVLLVTPRHMLACAYAHSGTMQHRGVLSAVRSDHRSSALRCMGVVDGEMGQRPGVVMQACAGPGDDNPGHVSPPAHEH